MDSEAFLERVHVGEGFDEVLRERQAAAEQILRDLTATLDASANTASLQDRHPSSKQSSSPH